VGAPRENVLEAEKIPVPKEVLAKAGKALPADVAKRFGLNSTSQALATTSSSASASRSAIASARQAGAVGVARSTLRAGAPLALAATALECGWAQVKFMRGEIDRPTRNKAIAKSAASNSGALAGAAAGATAGSFIPVIGTAVGAFIGGLIGGIAAAKAAEAGMS
jgi:phage tail tape-measure protein